MKFSVRKLREVQKHILEEPMRFAMGVVQEHGKPGDPIRLLDQPGYWNYGNPYEAEQVYPSCGTAACIIGWWDVLGGNRTQRQYLGKLCAVSSWPKKFRDRYRKAKQPLTRAKIAAEVIDQFIRTNGAE